ncbi:MAG TPA: hypothetical protein VNT22_00460, partial [Baekduia sp.]|nr:hypothetical protein [Baekduia sp.]
MQSAIHFPVFEPAGGAAAIASELAAGAVAADEGGAKTITLMDHWFQMEMAGRSEDPMLEGYTGLGFLAGLTKRAQLGLLVT